MTVLHDLFWDLSLDLLTIGNASFDANFPNGFQPISVTDDVEVQLQVLWDLGCLSQALSDLVLLGEGDIINEEDDILGLLCPDHLLNKSIQLSSRDRLWVFVVADIMQESGSGKQGEIVILSYRLHDLDGRTVHQPSVLIVV